MGFWLPSPLVFSEPGESLTTKFMELFCEGCCWIICWLLICFYETSGPCITKVKVGSELSAQSQACSSTIVLPCGCLCLWWAKSQGTVVKKMVFGLGSLRFGLLCADDAVLLVTSSLTFSVHWSISGFCAKPPEWESVPVSLKLLFSAEESLPQGGPRNWPR